MKTAWMIVASVTLAGCGLHGSSGATHEAPSGSELVAGGGPDRVAAPGIGEPWDGEVALAPPEAGWIAEIFVHEGERVRRGQTL
ncbi:MAG: efflux RND transporter periplasmic adaptor subunit, partial [Deltaproteobacteria bacterium]|nr:efflux RND transporter periplasmic adaptor subunit [Kofleriaceae bacterium]